MELLTPPYSSASPRETTRGSTSSSSSSSSSSSFSIDRYPPLPVQPVAPQPRLPPPIGDGADYFSDYRDFRFGCRSTLDVEGDGGVADADAGASKATLFSMAPHEAAVAAAFYAERQHPAMASVDRPKRFRRSKAAIKEDEGKNTCQICGDRASGCHYSVISCEGCKAFFRRSISKDSHYECKFEGKCYKDLDAWMRRKCQKCRLQRCFDEGMKREYVLSDQQRKMRKKPRPRKKSAFEAAGYAASAPAGAGEAEVPYDSAYDAGNDAGFSPLSSTSSSDLGAAKNPFHENSSPSSNFDSFYDFRRHSNPDDADAAAENDVVDRHRPTEERPVFDTPPCPPRSPHLYSQHDRLPLQHQTHPHHHHHHHHSHYRHPHHHPGQPFDTPDRPTDRPRPDSLRFVHSSSTHPSTRSSHQRHCQSTVSPVTAAGPEAALAVEAKADEAPQQPRISHRPPPPPTPPPGSAYEEEEDDFEEMQLRYLEELETWFAVDEQNGRVLSPLGLRMLEQLIEHERQFEVTKDKKELLHKLSFGPDPPASEDVDQPFRAGLQGMVAYTYITTQLIVEFARKVPGFNILSVDKRCQLLKHATSEIMIIRSAKRYDAKEKKIRFEGDKLVGKVEFISSGLVSKEADYVEPMFDWCEKLMGDLEVDETELVLLTCISLFRCCEHRELQQQNQDVQRGMTGRGQQISGRVRQQSPKLQQQQNYRDDETRYRLLQQQQWEESRRRLPPCDRDESPPPSPTLEQRLLDHYSDVLRAYQRHRVPRRPRQYHCLMLEMATLRRIAAEQNKMLTGLKKEMLPKLLAEEIWAEHVH